MSEGTASPKPARPAFCPECRGPMDQRDVKCPHCGYDFPSTDLESHLLPLWAWFAFIAVAFVVIAFELGVWIEIGAVVLCLVFALLRATWRRWDRYWNRW